MCGKRLRKVQKFPYEVIYFFFVKLCMLVLDMYVDYFDIESVVKKNATQQISYEVIYCLKLLCVIALMV
jgi:hypothetical protein